MVRLSLQLGATDDPLPIEGTHTLSGRVPLEK
jgi:hypothetical protein